VISCPARTWKANDPAGKEISEACLAAVAQHEQIEPSMSPTEKAGSPILPTQKTEPSISPTGSSKVPIQKTEPSISPTGSVTVIMVGVNITKDDAGNAEKVASNMTKSEAAVLFGVLFFLLFLVLLAAKQYWCSPPVAALGSSSTHSTVGDESVHSPMTGSFPSSDDRVAPPISAPTSRSSPFQGIIGWMMGQRTSAYSMVQQRGSAPSSGLFTIEGDDDDEEGTAGRQQGL